MPNIALGLSWDGKRFAALALSILVAMSTLIAAPVQAAESTAKIIVLEADGSGDAPEALLVALGGTVTQPLDLVNGFAAEIPASQVETLRSSPLVVSVVLDGSVQLQGSKDLKVKVDKDAEKVAKDAKKAAEKEAEDAAKAADKAAEEAQEAAEKAAKDAEKAAKDSSEAAEQTADEATTATDEQTQDQDKEAEDEAKDAEKAAKDAKKSAEKSDKALEKAAEAKANADKASDKAASKLQEGDEDAADEFAQAIAQYTAQIEAIDAALVELEAQYAVEYAALEKEIEKHEKKATDDTKAAVDAQTELVKVLGEKITALAKDRSDAVDDLAKTEQDSRKAAFSLLEETLKAVKVDAYWSNGFDGSGVDIAIIDSGIAPVQGLNGSGKVVNGPDLSFDSMFDEVRYLDNFGHGTHLAGIIAGNDTSSAPSMDKIKEEFYGVAPGSRLINVKVADHSGAVDVSQVIAAIDWVVQHRNDNGMNIRVLNLSFGTSGVQDYQLDPLSYAVEQAWHHGIVVVVAAGNDGNDGQLRNPATNPFVIAVGAINSNGTIDTADDEVTDFSNCGDGTRSIDVYAPGQTLLSLRVKGSTIDEANPEAVIHDRFFKGSGTSQATAVVSGLAALILDQRPNATPDQVKALLTDSSKKIKGFADECLTGGTVHMGATYDAATPNVTQAHVLSTGLGTLNGSRGDHQLTHDGVTLNGEMDIFGNAWLPGVWAPLSAQGSSWSGGDWNGSSWSGSSWSGSSWSGSSWSGSSWSGSSWSGSSWSGSSWSGSSWSGSSWSGSSWSGSSWSGSSWSGSSWSGSSWSGNNWG